MSDGEYAKNLPLLSVVNNHIDGAVRWCTPSIHPRVPKVRGIYENDMSVSYHGLGNPSLDTGVFGEATKLAAKAYGSEHTLFSVNGSTGSNFIVLRALKHQLGEVNMLAQRNVHKSISVASEDYDINVTFLDPIYDDTLQVFIPNSIEEYAYALGAHPEINVVMITNPTYEGLSLNLPKLVRTLRKINKHIIIFVDEAWGAHFPFSAQLPVTAMEAGADVSVHSTHKLGSGLQQTSMIHWQGNRISSDHLMASYRSLMTTSPSYHLLASLDAARYFMETYGADEILNVLTLADYFRGELALIKDLHVVYEHEFLTGYDQISATDRTKVLVNVAGTGLSGFEIAHHLEEHHKVVVEKYEANNILFVTTFQNTRVEAALTAKYLRKSIRDLRQYKVSLRKFSFPIFPNKIVKKIPSHEVTMMKLADVNAEDTVGEVCGEDIVPYPPGIPLLVKGELIQSEHVAYLKAIRKTNGLLSVVMHDDALKKISIVTH
jgi:arginine decarboxylase